MAVETHRTRTRRLALEVGADLIEVDPDDVEVEVTIKMRRSLVDMLVELNGAEATEWGATRAARELGRGAVRITRY